jgi:hypothetical protein
LRIHPIPEVRILYVEVPKAACSSMKRALAPFRYAAEPPIDHEELHRWFGYTVCEPSDFDEWRKTYWKGWFTFTVIRHPIDRFESLFYSKVNVGPIDRWALRFPNDYWASDDHGRPQVDVIGHDLSRFDLVGRVEDMDVVAKTLSEVTGSVVRVPHVNHSPRGPHLSGVARELIATFYAEDFTSLGYEP